MTTVFLKGDLFHDSGLDALAHGCNCAGAMGKGIAVEFRRRFPQMYVEYKKRCDDGRFQPGDVFPWCEGEITVFNLATQKTWRSQAEIFAIETAVRAMVALAEKSAIRRIGLPRIGAGLGGLPWKPVRKLLQRIGEGTEIDLIVVEEYIPTP